MYEHKLLTSTNCKHRISLSSVCNCFAQRVGFAVRDFEVSHFDMNKISLESFGSQVFEMFLQISFVQEINVSPQFPEEFIKSLTLLLSVRWEQSLEILGGLLDTVGKIQMASQQLLFCLAYILKLFVMLTLLSLSVIKYKTFICKLISHYLKKKL